MNIYALFIFVLTQKRTAAADRQKSQVVPTGKNPNASALSACARPPDFQACAL